MGKRALSRGLLGIPLGITIGYIITIIISFGIGQGYYSPCVPSLIGTIGTEIGAVALQAGLCGLIGGGFAAASVIWEIETWSIAKQTGIYFFMTSLIMLPIAYFTEWMAHTVIGFIFYFGIFAGIFVIIWVIQYCFWKRKIKKFNAKIDNK
jgi:hypothetical protein